MGIATLIIFIVIILVATVAAVIMIQATNAVKQQAQSTTADSQAKIARRIVPDLIYLIVDQNMASPYYKKAVTLWIQAKVPKYGAPVDLRKTTLIVQTPDAVYYAHYIDADGDEIFGDNACETTSPYPVNDPNNPGNVDYNALKENTYTVVWINCEGHNEDYMVYPGQLFIIVYRPKNGLPPGIPLKISIVPSNGGSYTIKTTLPDDFDDQQVISIPV